MLDFHLFIPLAMFKLFLLLIFFHAYHFPRFSSKFDYFLLFTAFSCFAVTFRLFLTMMVKFERFFFLLLKHRIFADTCRLEKLWLSTIDRCQERFLARNKKLVSRITFFVSFFFSSLVGESYASKICLSLTAEYSEFFSALGCL